MSLGTSDNLRSFGGINKPAPPAQVLGWAAIVAVPFAIIPADVFVAIVIISPESCLRMAAPYASPAERLVLLVAA